MEFLLNSILKGQSNYPVSDASKNQLPQISQNQNQLENNLISQFYQKKQGQSQLAQELPVNQQQNNMFLTSYLLLQNIAQQNKTNQDGPKMMQQLQDQSKINFANQFLSNLLAQPKNQTQQQPQPQQNLSQLTQQNQQNYQNFKQIQTQWQQQFKTQENQQKQIILPNQLNLPIKSAQPLVFPQQQQQIPDLCREHSIIDKKSKKIKKQNTKCGHLDREHYAKGMCNTCYHRFGRNKKPTLCPHTNAKLYAHGLCQNCYINNYNKVKREGLTKQIEESIKQEPDLPGNIQQNIISKEN